MKTLSKQETIDRLSVFDDTLYLFNQLRAHADEMEEDAYPSSVAYDLREAADNLDGLYDLCRQLIKHLKASS